MAAATSAPLPLAFWPALYLVWLLPVLALLAAAGWTVFAFNRLVRQKNLVTEAWSGIDVQLRRRRDLIPNLLEVVKGYSGYEKALIQRVTELRASSEQAGTVKEAQTRENALTDQLRGLLALAESYPDVKASRAFLELQKQLAHVEDQLQMARRYYNGATREYNIRVESFPSNLVAMLFGYQAGEFFQIASATDRAAPKVDLP